LREAAGRCAGGDYLRHGPTRYTLHKDTALCEGVR